LAQYISSHPSNSCHVVSLPFFLPVLRCHAAASFTTTYNIYPLLLTIFSEKVIITSLLWLPPRVVSPRPPCLSCALSSGSLLQVWKISESKSIRILKYLLRYPIILVQGRHFPGLSRHLWSICHLVAAASFTARYNF
jgi:hypothetical protein